MRVKNTTIGWLCAAFGILLGAAASAAAQNVDASPLFSEKKVKHYLPHMTWPEVERALTETDAVIIPVGSTEQHGKHLPLGSDSYGAVEVAKLIAQNAEVLVAPSVLAGLSEHHMAFPGTLTLTPATLEAVLYETAQSLIRHGFRKILFLNGHGGNSVSVANVIQRVNQTTPAVAVDLGRVKPPRKEPLYPAIPFDVHAGVEETAQMLYLTGGLIDMSKAENPVLSFPPDMMKIIDLIKTDPNLEQIPANMGFRPLETGKKTSTREVTNNGAVTSGDITKATAERGRRETEEFVAAAVRFIEAWRKANREPRR